MIYVLVYTDGELFSNYSFYNIGAFSTKEKAEEAIQIHHESLRPRRKFRAYTYAIDELLLDKLLG